MFIGRNFSFEIEMKSMLNAIKAFKYDLLFTKKDER